MIALALVAIAVAAMLRVATASRVGGDERSPRADRDAGSSLDGRTARPVVAGASGSGADGGRASEHQASAPPPIPAVARAARPGRRVVLVGLDGADWNLLDAYIERGLMPNLARLVREGRGGVLTSEHPPLSPLLWTTMMTGVGPLEHGVLDFARLHPESGRKEPIGSAERQAPALWNMATWAGRSVAVLGMWATYPAEPVRGLVVSDRLFSFLYQEAEPPPGVVHPAAATAGARRALARAEAAVDYDRLARYLPWLEREEYERLRPAADPYAHPVSALRRILVETAVYHELAMEHLEAARPDLTIVYIQGTDTIGHTFARYVPPRLPGVDPRDAERYGLVPERYFREVDHLLGDYQRAAQELGAVLLLVSDHGFRWGEGRPAELSSHRNETAAKWHRPEGIFLAWGDGIEAARPASLARRGAPPSAPEHPLEGELRQVAATVLALLRLPAGEGVAGPPLPGIAQAPAGTLDYASLYEPAGEGAALVRSGASGAAARTPATDAAAEADLAKLRALGYLGGADARPRAAPRRPQRAGPDRGGVLTEGVPAAAGEAAPHPTWTAGAFNNRGLVLRRQGRDAEAVASFERALELDPELASALWNLSDLLHGRDRDLPRSDRLLVEAVARGLPEGTRYLVGRAIGYQRSGRLDRAIELLDRATRSIEAAPPDVWLFLGRYEMERGECAPALGRFERAVDLAPRSHQAHGAAAMARLCLGDERGAAADLRRSLALEPDQPELAAYLDRLTK